MQPKYHLVFQGEATDEEDKLALVAPVLGLYAELLATAQSGSAIDGSVSEQAVASHACRMLSFIKGSKEEVLPAQIVIRDTAERRAWKAHVQRAQKSQHRGTLAGVVDGMVSGLRSPLNTRSSRRNTRSSRRSSDASLSLAESKSHEPGSSRLSSGGDATVDDVAAAGERRVLFGGKIERLERMIQEDAELRRSLAEQSTLFVESHKQLERIVINEGSFNKGSACATPEGSFDEGSACATPELSEASSVLNARTKAVSGTSASRGQKVIRVQAIKVASCAAAPYT